MGLKILGVASSMRESSYSTRVLKLALEKAEKCGAQTELLDLRELQLQCITLNKTVHPNLTKLLSM